jgi:hypothetical protein
MWPKAHTSIYRAPEELARIEALNDKDIFLPMEYIQAIWIPTVIISMIVVYVVYGLCFVLANFVLPSDSGVFRRRKLSYQMASVFGNGFLAASGLYYEFFTVSETPTLEDTISGFQEFYILSAFQFGYQLWALPVGIIHAQETTAMVVHHFAVLMVSIFSGCMTNGFRYHIPFFFGMFEISSVPLVIMNMFKENPTWIEKHPSFNHHVRVAFAVSFLWIRIVMDFSRAYVYLRDVFILYTSNDSLSYVIFMSGVFMSSLILFFLQLWWGWQIALGLCKLLLGTSKSVVTIPKGIKGI